MNELVKNLRKEAARNAEMQGDKDKHTNHRRKTFRFRNHLFTEAADKIESLRNTIYELQMEDTLLGFIERVQDAGLHHEWGEFMELLHKSEKGSDRASMIIIDEASDVPGDIWSEPLKSLIRKLGVKK